MKDIRGVRTTGLQSMIVKVSFLLCAALVQSDTSWRWFSLSDAALLALSSLSNSLFSCTYH